MRERKFRYTCVKPLLTFSQIFHIDKIEKGEVALWKERNATHVGVVNISEYIGVNDKNGTEIYEDDIVQFWTQSTIGSLNGIIEVVEYNNGACMPFWDGKYIDDEQGDWFEDNTIEVIGNKFENPELLNQ